MLLFSLLGSGLFACAEYNFFNQSEAEEAAASHQDSEGEAWDSQPSPQQDSEGEAWDSQPSPQQDSEGEPPDEERCDGQDNDGDGAVDEGFDLDKNGEADCFEQEEIFCKPFDNFKEWSFGGGGSWTVADGILLESQGGYYYSTAYTEDQGTADHFSLQVDASYAGSLNDFSGLVWGVQGDRYFVARWDDPQDDYDRYEPAGAADIVYCEGENCTQLAFDQSHDLFQPSDGSWSTWTLTVRGDQVSMLRDGVQVLSALLPEVAGSGPGRVGVYSNDNDGGVFYDNFCLWVGK